uniref:Uncharacterized protein n=1 Tax=Triticum urartu TaxID=4572 RepID=A0A8R7TBH7_TRIUA
GSEEEEEASWADGCCNVSHLPSSFISSSTPTGFFVPTSARGGVLVLGGLEFGESSAGLALQGPGVLHAVPGPALPDLLRPDLELGDGGGDAAAGPAGLDLVGAGDEEGAADIAAGGGVVGEVVREVVDAILDVVGDIADLLHPVLHPAVVAPGGEVDEEGLHACHLVVDVLDVAAHAADERVLVRQQPAQLAQQRLHRRLRRAHHHLHGCLERSSDAAAA